MYSVAPGMVYSPPSAKFPDAPGARVALFLAAPGCVEAAHCRVWRTPTVPRSIRRWWWCKGGGGWRGRQRRWRPGSVARRIVGATARPVFPDALGGARFALCLAAEARKEAIESLILHSVTCTMPRHRRWRRRRIGTTVAIPPLVGRAVFPDAPGARVALLAAGPPRHLVAAYSLCNVHKGAQQTPWRLWWRPGQRWGWWRRWTG